MRHSVVFLVAGLAIGEACGGCVGEPAPLADGTRCTDGGECERGVCAGMDPDGRYCTSRCAWQRGCAEGFLCESGACYLEGDGTLGSPCGDAADCVSGVCARGGTCSVPCDVRRCPETFECLDEEGLCAPEPGELSFGQSCGDDDDCRSNLCVGRTCTRPCDLAPCPGAYECQTHGDGKVCAKTSEGEGRFDGGCGCGASPSPPVRGLVLLWALTPLVRRRRRSR